MRDRRLILSLSALCFSATITLALAARDRQAEAYTSLSLPSLTTTEWRSTDHIGTFSIVAERPVFSSSRRPNAPLEAAPSITSQPATPAPPVAPAAMLVGVLLSSTGGTAVLRHADGKSSSLIRGEKIAGWTLEEIGPDRVVLTSGTDRYELAFPAPKHSSLQALSENLDSQPLRKRR